MSRGAKGLAWLGLALALGGLPGCGKQPAVRADEAGQRSDLPLPFEERSEHAGASPTADLAPPAIPAGTPITVRLEAALSSATSHAGDSFRAVLDQPLVLHGSTIAARGRGFSGEILAVKPSAHSGDPGYMRLTLKRMSFNSKPIAIRTSSIFVKADSRDAAGSIPDRVSGAQKPALVGTAVTGSGRDASVAAGKNDIEFSTARRLTFRLVESAAIPR